MVADASTVRYLRQTQPAAQADVAEDDADRGALAAQPEATAPLSRLVVRRHDPRWEPGALAAHAGIALGHFFTTPLQMLGAMEVAQINLPVAVLIWLMIIPMLVKVDFGALRQIKEHWRGIGVTLFINGRSSHSPWRCSPGCSSAGCSRRGCRPRRSPPTSRA
jgi:hypothetical protein